jgi:hypothetical protein
MPGFTNPGDVVVTERKAASHAPHTEGDPDLEKLYAAELGARGRQAHAALTAGSLFNVSGGRALLLSLFPVSPSDNDQSLITQL